MKNFIVIVFVVAVVLLGVIWYYSGRNSHATEARRELTGAASQTKQFVEDKLGVNHLTAQDIKDEMARTGRVIREKAQQAGASIKDATADARITTEIKAKLVRDPDLSAINISVSTTDGKVTLSGTASSADNIRKAIQLAMDTDGVREVVSTLQVKS